MVFRGYLAGIVGETTADLTTVTALGLNLNNADNDEIQIAGIAGVADEITDARYISAAACQHSKYRNKSHNYRYNTAYHKKAPRGAYIRNGKVIHKRAEHQRGYKEIIFKLCKHPRS